MVLYTSGTTGRPKGTHITHLAVENYAESYCAITELDGNDVLALYHSIGFDVHIESLFSPIIAGISVVIVPEDVRLDMNALREFADRHGITNLDLPASVCRYYVAEHPDAGLKCLVTGGEKFGESVMRTRYRFIDMYGPTEFTVSATYADVSSRSRPESVGVPFPNSKAYILDAEHRRVPVGAVGELFLSGYQI